MIRGSRTPHLLRHTTLGQEAVYRVINVVGKLVEVEVVSAPGLAPGTVLRFTQAAVAGMSVVEEPMWRRGRHKRGVRTDQESTESARPHAAGR